MRPTVVLFDVDGTLLSAGGAGVNHYQYEVEPTGRSHRCGLYGNYSMFIADRDYNILAKAAQYYGAQMLTQQWLQPGDQPNEIYSVTTDHTSKNPPLTAYAAKRPDGTWSVMLVNKDREGHSVTLRFASNDGDLLFKGPTTEIRFGEEQYRWQGRSATELPNQNFGPLKLVSRGVEDPLFVPPLSIVVIRGSLRLSVIP